VLPVDDNKQTRIGSTLRHADLHDVYT